jgi:SNF2 family DNA or RNA helicase
VPPDIEVKLDDELASLKDSDVRVRVRLDVTEDGIDWFNLKVVVDMEDLSLTPEEIAILMKAKGKMVRLPGKGWRRLTYNISEEEDQRLADLGLSPHELNGDPQRLHTLQLAHGAARRFLPETQAEAIQRRASEIKARITPDLPANMTAELRPYQREGFNFLAYLSTNQFGGILADDMGLGKTVQTLTWLLWLRSENATHANPDRASKPLPSLVVCPKSVMDNWQSEAARFAPGLRVRLWRASDLAGLQASLHEADLHVLNYSGLRGIEPLAKSIRWLAVILDEGQYIKNPNSLAAQVARSLVTSYRLVLTGTPIENRLMDLWSLMAFAMPGALGNRNRFGKIYDSKADPLARRRLSARVRPFLLRRTKLQVAKDLPERMEEDLYCEIEGEQSLLYKAQLKEAQKLLLNIKTKAQFQRESFNFLTALLRLRQICCHPKLVNDESKADSAKTEALIDLLEPIIEEGDKVLVFSQFVEVLHILAGVAKKQDWKHFMLTGSTEDRGDLVNEFQNHPGAAVFFISLKAGGFGLNLTAANYVVLFDPWWNPAVERQAIDRTHRIGQTRKIIAYRLLIKDTVEEKIRLLQRQKSALAEDVLGEEKFSQSLTMDDLKFLFAD